VGAEPIGVTDCLNFGSPERPEVFWTFREAVEGIAEACEALGVPVIGGNVSFYNEAESAGGERASGERAVPPTPVVAMVGLLDDVGRHGRPGFVRSGDAIVLMGGDQVSLNASLYCAVIHGEDGGAPVNPDFDRALAAIRCVREAVRLNILESVHDCGDGGLAVAVAEACIQGEIGAEVALPRDTAARGSCTDAWFGEGPGRFVASVAPSRLPELQAHAAACGATCAVIGTVGGDALSLLWRDGRGGLQRRALPLDRLAAAWRSLEV
jgi:phosphoribosylformylglycinamidine synthase